MGQEIMRPNDETALARQGVDIGGLIKVALENKSAIDIIERLMALKERQDAKASEQAYNQAMSDFQNRCPTIPRDKHVNFNQTDFWYATLDQIIKIVRPILQECGLSYSINSTFDDKLITVNMYVRHTGGHTANFEMTVPIDEITKTSMNPIQRYGSARSYAARYVFIGAFGIMSADDDNTDAKAGKPSAGPLFAQPAQPPVTMAELLEVIKTGQIDGKIDEFLLSIQWIGPGQTFLDLPLEKVEAIVRKSEGFIAKVKSWEPAPDPAAVPVDPPADPTQEPGTTNV